MVEEKGEKEQRSKMNKKGIGERRTEIGWGDAGDGKGWVEPTLHRKRPIVTSLGP